MIIEAKDRIYLHDVMHMEFTLTYSGELVAGIPHGKGMVPDLQDVVQNNKFFIFTFMECVCPCIWSLYLLRGAFVTGFKVKAQL